MLPSPAMIRCAASAIVCSPDEQKRLIVAPGTETGQPARSAIWRAMFQPVAPSGSAQPIITSSISAGSTPARAIVWRTTCPPSVAPCDMLNAPRQDFASPVRAVETTTASRIERLSFGCEARKQRRRLPERRIGMRIVRQAPQRAHDVVRALHVRVQHRSAAPEGETVAGQVDDIDVGSAQRDA